MLTRSRVALVVGLVALLAGAVVLVVATRHSGDKPRTRAIVPRAKADALARQACQLMKQAIAQIDANGATRTVLDLADRARDAAGDAEYGSARWVVLSGAVQSLDKALHTDDPTLARLGIQQIGPACAETGVTVRGQ